MNESNSIPSGALPPPAPLTFRPVYEAGGRERVLLLLSLALGILAADLLLSVGQNWLGLGVPAGVAAWYAVLLWYVGPKKLGRTWLLFGSVILLALTFVFFSNVWFRFWNTGFLPVLLTVHAFQISGAGKKPWSVPSMLWERFRLLLDGLFGRLGAIGAALRGFTGPSARRGLMAGLGVLVTLPVLLLAAVLLGQADMLFHRLTADLLDGIRDSLDVGAAKLFLGLLAAPFLFSLLYALGRPKPLAEKEGKAPEAWRLDSIVGVMALGGLDALDLFFVGVQARALFGGEDYLAQMGISYAEYARSGFFQLVFVAALNLVVVLTLVQLTGREGSGWRAVRLLSTALVALSGVILVSAAWRMTLYVLTYGLSFKRALTYWGMAMIALLLAAACVKVWRERFGFFRFASAAVLAGWLVLNYANVDRIVAQYNVDACLSGNLEHMDLTYLTSLSCEALPVLAEKLDPNTVLAPGSETTVGNWLSLRASWAEYDCSRWETWSLPVWQWTVSQR